MTDIDLEAIRARVEATTPGPWQMLLGNSWAGEVVVATEGGHPLALVSTAKDDTAAQADGAFIAHARTDIPALIAAVQRRDDALAAVLALCDRAERNYGGPTGMANLEAWVHLGSVRAAITAHLSPADNPTTED